MLLTEIPLSDVAEHAGLRGCRGDGRFQRELDCEHDAADVDQLWRGLCGIDDGVLCAGCGVLRFRADDRRDSQGASLSRRIDAGVDGSVYRTEAFLV
jgi:hypothetical protein